MDIHKLTPPITKTSLAKAMGCHYRSINNYHQVACTYLDDFLPDYPTISGKYETASPMTYYQAWCIWKVKLFLDFYPMSSILKNGLENDPRIQQSWSKKAFFAEYPEYTDDDSTQSALTRQLKTNW
jgi:hypothetical protein